MLLEVCDWSLDESTRIKAYGRFDQDVAFILDILTHDHLENNEQSTEIPIFFWKK